MNKTYYNSLIDLHKHGRLSAQEESKLSNRAKQRYNLFYYNRAVVIHSVINLEKEINSDNPNQDNINKALKDIETYSQLAKQYI